MTQNEPSKCDIVKQLSYFVTNEARMPAGLIVTVIEEIKRLRASLALAVGELSTYGPMKYTSPDQLLEQFMQEARRG